MGQALTWRRYRQLVGAHYELLDNEEGESTGWWVLHCGHPTAVRPYYIVRRDGSVSRLKYRHVADAQVVAVGEYLGRVEPDLDISPAEMIERARG